jgi:hypothetical protein
MNTPPIPPNADRWTLQSFDTPIGIGSVIDNLLKLPGRILHECKAGSVKVPVLLALISLACLGLFGFLLGTFSGEEQLWAAPAKIAGGTAFAVLICLPSLYIFAALGGMEAKLLQIFGVLLAAIALTSILLVGFGPIVWVFSQSTESVPFMGGLAIVFWMIALIFGTKILLAAGASIGGQNSGYLNTWIMIFIIVTLQMSTALRPIIGKADTLLPTEKRFFLGHWLREMEGSR